MDHAPDSSRARTILSDAGLTPSKSKGQNFLIQGAIADRIVASAGLTPSDEVVEIGPGLGILTERLLQHDIHRLTVVELDHNLAQRLRERFDGDPRVAVVETDFLRIDYRSITNAPAKVIGNLPFNAASAIFRVLCDHHGLVAMIVAMFQREVGERLRAMPGDSEYSALSVYAALYFNIDLHFRVAAGSFHPRPKVDAEVLRFTPRTELPFAIDEERFVLEVVRASFSAPRKQIRNSLSHSLGIEAAKIAQALERAAIDPGTRAETLSVHDFVRLSRVLAPLISRTIGADA